MRLPMNAVDEFLVGTEGVLFLKDKMRSLTLMQKAREIGDLEKMRASVFAATGRKPWEDHGPGGPWGDPDGDDLGHHKIPPGEEGSEEPEKSPDNDLDIRAKGGLRGVMNSAISSGQLAPEATMALVAVEARLAEITLYLPAAIAGTAGAAQASLNQFQSII